MSKFHAVAFALAMMAPVGAFAGDGDKVEKKEEPKPVVVETKPEPAASSTTTVVTTTDSSDSCDVCKKGNKFTRFWTHTVGGNIGGGLKKGGSKISGAF